MQWRVTSHPRCRMMRWHQPLQLHLWSLPKLMIKLMISREALWEVLRLYGVHPHVMKLLMIKLMIKVMISREALWEVLRLYGVHPHVMKLLEDLHTGTEAVVGVDGEAGRSFTVKAGVQQGVRNRTYAL
eukprot:364386-Chlamydomonas_euryale.AAC.4